MSREMTDDAYWDAIGEQRAHEKRIGSFEDAMERARAARDGDRQDQR